MHIIQELQTANCSSRLAQNSDKKSLITSNKKSAVKKPFFAKCKLCGNEYYVLAEFMGHKKMHKENAESGLLEKAAACNSSLPLGNTSSNSEPVIISNQALKSNVHPPECSSPGSLNNNTFGDKISVIEKPSYKCKICLKVYTVRKQLTNHIRRHKINKNTGLLKNTATCSSSVPLENTSSNSEPLRNSTQILKSNIELPEWSLPVNLNTKRFVDNLSAIDKPHQKCKICGKVYTDRNKFKTHKKNHIRNKNTVLRSFVEHYKTKKLQTASCSNSLPSENINNNTGPL